ncbi:MAG: acyl-CoA dehydrogenase family protein [Micromonosporaceae bacterium]
MTEEQRALQEAVRSLLERHAGSAAVRAAVDQPRGFDEKLWHLLCDQIGVAGLGIPEAYGGAGASLVETALVLEELGRVLAPAPLLGSAVLAGQAVLATGDADACARLLPAIADGTRIAALAWSDASGHWHPDRPAATAAEGPDGWRLDGDAHFVLDGDIADVLLVATGDGLFEVDPDAARREPTPAMDLTRRLARVTLEAAPARPLGRTDLALVRDIGCAALAAEQAGAAARALDLTVAYAKTREQFGQPIGAFQALKHRMAEMYVQVESARAIAYAAAAAPSELGAVAKVHCSEAFQQVTAEMIQLHGGIAITWEHDAHLYFKRAHGSAQLFGQPGEYVSRLTATALTAH